MAAVQHIKTTGDEDFFGHRNRIHVAKGNIKEWEKIRLGEHDPQSDNAPKVENIIELG